MRTIEFSPAELALVRMALEDRGEQIKAMLSVVEGTKAGIVDEGRSDGLIAALKGNLLGVDVVLAKVGG